MGSRKKKYFNQQSDLKKLRIAHHYSQLSIHEKINFRTFHYWLGRQRLNFCDVLSKNCPKIISLEDMKYTGEIGIYHFLNKPII